METIFAVTMDDGIQSLRSSQGLQAVLPAVLCMCLATRCTWRPSVRRSYRHSFETVIQFCSVLLLLLITSLFHRVLRVLHFFKDWGGG